MGANEHSKIPEPRALLVRGVNWLGDAVMSLPAIQRVRERFPQARITLLAPAKLEQLWTGHNAIDAVQTFGPNDSLFSVARRLRQAQFDAALILPNSPRSALESWLAGIPRRVGFAGHWRGVFLTHAVPSPVVKMHKRSTREVKKLILAAQSARPAALRPQDHQVHNYLRLAVTLGCSDAATAPRLEMRPEETRAIVSDFSEVVADTRDNSAMRLGLNISAAYGPAKRWPLDRFAAVVRQVRTRVPNVTWLAFGAGEDRDMNEELAKQAGGGMVNLAGKTSLRQLMALLKNCRVLLTNDSGPMHLAAALGTSVVVPFGSTSPELTGPGLPDQRQHHLLRSNAPCSPCFRRDCPIDLRCMTGISVEQVAEAVLNTIEGK